MPVQVPSKLSSSPQVVPPPQVVTTSKGAGPAGPSVDIGVPRAEFVTRGANFFYKILQFFGGLVLRCIETEEITPKIGAKIDEVEKTIASIAKKNIKPTCC